MYSKMELKFKSDTSFRKQFFVPDSFAHPAKMDAQLVIWIVEHYTNPGEVILDPMAGMGTTMLACILGRDVVLVELEEKFCKLCLDNWEQVKMRPQLGSTMGDCQVIQGDARDLEGLFDSAIFSPPFGEAMSGGGIARYGHFSDPELAQRAYSAENMNIKKQIKRVKDGKAKMKRPDVFTSEGNKAAKGFFEGNYSRDPLNIGNLPYGQIDKIVTSPPYEGSLSGIDDEDRAKEFERMRARGMRFNPLSHSNVTRGTEYSKDKGNIGNLKSQSYLEAMLQVYQQCHKVLKPQGLMILAVKNFIRDKQIVRLDQDTIKLCEQAGFSFLERHYRKLSRQSFWRIIYHQKYPGVEKIEHEDVLVFRK